MPLFSFNSSNIIHSFFTSASVRMEPILPHTSFFLIFAPFKIILMDNKDIRWHQRFENFGKSMTFLERAMAIEHPDIIQKAGMIQFFEMSFELAWNTLKDYLEEEGFIDLKSPRSTIKKAFEIGFIDNGHAWLQLLEDRNLTSHTYDEETTDMVEKLIHETYYPMLKKLWNSFNNLNNG